MDATPILLKMVTIAFMMDNDFLVLLVLLYYVQILILIWSIISSYVLLIDYNATSVMQISKMIITLKSKFPHVLFNHFLFSSDCFILFIFKGSNHLKFIFSLISIYSCSSCTRNFSK